MIVERPGLERRVRDAVDAGRIPVVLGGCGMGRTSLLLRLEQTLGPDRAQYLDFAAAATTPERCLAAVLRASRLTPPADRVMKPGSARAAFDGLLAVLDESRTATGGVATFLIDEFLDLRTFESFPGLRHIQREIITRLADSRTQFVLASRFTARVHRLLRDAPARFEVVHAPPFDGSEVLTLAARLDHDRVQLTPETAAAVAALAAGRVGYVTVLLDAIAALGPTIDPVAALGALLAPDGRLTARCRESYEFRLHRARGYGALKAILGVLADEEPLNLTEISLALRRTPGSTKDYLSWLEDVDLITSQGKRYSFTDPLLRLYVRLYGRPVPPSDDEIVREIGAYARRVLPQVDAPEPVSVSRGEGGGEGSRTSGIIEID